MSSVFFKDHMITLTYRAPSSQGTISVDPSTPGALLPFILEKELLVPADQIKVLVGYPPRPVDPGLPLLVQGFTDRMAITVQVGGGGVVRQGTTPPPSGRTVTPPPKSVSPPPGGSRIHGFGGAVVQPRQASPPPEKNSGPRVSGFAPSDLSQPGG